MSDKFIIEIALTHDHGEGQRLPDYFQAMYVPLDEAGQPKWEWAEPITSPIFTTGGDDEANEVRLIQNADEGLNEFLSVAVTGALANEPERFEWSLEGPDDCAICPALAQQELVGQEGGQA